IGETVQCWLRKILKSQVHQIMHQITPRSTSLILRASCPISIITTSILPKTMMSMKKHGWLNFTATSGSLNQMCLLIWMS
ncbi:hypothetical protein APHAL10511_004042, partial [Amanita phalloides]